MERRTFSAKKNVLVKNHILNKKSQIPGILKYSILNDKKKLDTFCLPGMKYDVKTSKITFLSNMSRKLISKRIF